MTVSNQSAARAARLVKALAFVGALVLVAGALACGSTAPRRGPDPGDAVIRLTCSVPNAVVVINDREIGTIRSLRRGVALSPGFHRLEVRHPGFHSHYGELTLTRGEKRTVDIELAERLL